MTIAAFEDHLRQHLPHPHPDPRFRRVLLEQLLLEDVQRDPRPEPGLAEAWRRSAYLGALGVALAMGAAVGWWRGRGRDEDAA